MSEPQPIDDPAGIERVGEIAAAAPWLALSGETNALHAYRERLCLLALDVGGELFVVDLLALRGRPRALRPLEAVLGGGRPEIWVHGGEYLVAALKRDYRIALDGIVDGQQAAVLLGRPRTGYRALVGELAGATLAPPISVDWAARPLPAGAVAHAVDKVRYLPTVIEALLEQIRRADLDDELREAGREVGWTSADVGRFDPAGFLKLKGAHRLPDEARRVLRALWIWRDTKARALDVPPGRLLPNERLMDFARHANEVGARLRLERFHSRLVWGDIEALIDAVAHAQREPAPLPERREPDPPTAASRARAKRLKAWRAEEAARRGLGLQAILPAKALRYLELHGLASRDAVDGVPGLGARRVERYADVLSRLCEPGD